MRRFEATGDAWDSTGGPPGPVSIGHAGDSDHGPLSRQVIRSSGRPEVDPARAQTWSRLNVSGGPKDEPSTQRQFESGCPVCEVGWAGRLNVGSSVVNAVQGVGHASVTQCPTCPRTSSAGGAGMALALRDFTADERSGLLRATEAACAHGVLFSDECNACDNECASELVGVAWYRTEVRDGRRWLVVDHLPTGGGIQ